MLTTTQQYKQRLLVIVASKGPQRGRRLQAMAAAKGKESETFK